MTTTTTVALSSSPFFPIFGFIYLILIVFVIFTMWKVYAKAGKPGWACIIPIYNIVVLMQIVGRSGWFVLLFFIPLVNIIVSAIVAIDLAKAFGKSSTFGIVGLWLFSIVGYAMLAFGNATYIGQQKGGGTPTQPAPQTITPVTTAAPLPTNAPVGPSATPPGMVPPQTTTT